jgi:hypothetical protein
MQYSDKKPVKKSFNRWLVIGPASLLLIAGVLFGLEKTNVINLSHNSTPDQAPATQEKPVSGVDYSPATPQDNEDINAKKNSGEITQEPKAPDNDTTIQITFIANAQDAAGQPLLVRTILGGITDGTCDLKLTKDGASISKSASVILQNTTYMCDGFEIPLSELSTGEWQISLTVKASDGRQNVATTTTTLQ